MSAVIEEGLRIYPSAAIGFTRTVPGGGDTVVAEFLPGGVSFSTFVLFSEQEIKITKIL
jgi:hypothetical protein